MFNTDIKVLHIESSTRCNAECPQCPREDKDIFDKEKTTNLTLEKCKELFNKDFIKNLDKVFMCGNFGDPVASKYTLDIFRYFKKHNKNLTLGLNTNGSIQNTKWWIELASIFTNNDDYVVFSIDGLKDTNHIYRKNINWDKIITNATAFINAGGSAHWDMLVFKYNEHQLPLVQDLAKTLGFTWFRSKVSKRFKTTPIPGLEPPVNFPLPNIDNADKIICHALEEKSIYVSATGLIFPCCWIGLHEYTNDITLSNLLSTPNWQGLIQSWTDNPHSICTDTCGVNENYDSSFNLQWNTNIELKNTH